MTQLSSRTQHELSKLSSNEIFKLFEEKKTQEQKEQQDQILWVQKNQGKIQELEQKMTKTSSSIAEFKEQLKNENYTVAKHNQIKESLKVALNSLEEQERLMKKLKNKKHNDYIESIQNDDY